MKLSTRSRSGNIIDAETQHILNTETRHWENVIELLIAVIQLLAQQCLLLRGQTVGT